MQAPGPNEKVVPLDSYEGGPRVVLTWYAKFLWGASRQEVIDPLTTFALNLWKALATPFIMLTPRIVWQHLVTTVEFLSQNSPEIPPVSLETIDQELSRAIPLAINAIAAVSAVFFWVLWLLFMVERIVYKPMSQPEPLTWAQSDVIGHHFDHAVITHKQRWRHTIDGQAVRIADWTLD